MRILLLCATNRGLRFLHTLRELCPEDELIVCSFREEPHEPKYLDAIKGFAEGHGGTFFETKDVAAEQFRSVWEERIDIVFTVNWRFRIPFSFIQKVRLSAVCLHDSYLPGYRGFSPTVWSIVNGEESCGASMFHLAEEFDNGDLIDQIRIGIGQHETIADVLERTTEAYLTLLSRNLHKLKTGCAPRLPQDQSLATYTCKRSLSDGLIDWSQPTHKVYNLIRAVTHPYPGAFTYYQGSKLFVWSAIPNPIKRRYVGTVAGAVVEIRPGDGIVVLTGDGSLLVRTVQFEEQAEICAADHIKRLSARLG